MSRLLSFVFYLVAARTLTTEGFGVLRYTLALMMLAFGLLAVLVTAVTRELGAARGDSGRTGAVLGSTLAVAAALLAASLLVCAIASALGLTGSADLLGLLAAVVGYTLFQLYYAISRGLGDSARAVGAYVGGSAAQLAILVLLTIVADPGPRTALLVYAVSGLIPIAVFELTRPVVLRRVLQVTRVELGRLWSVGAPLILAQAAFLSWLTVDQIWVESSLGTREVGLYGAAKNVAQVFMVIPAGVTGVLLPRIAELRSRGDVTHARRLTYYSAAGTLGVSSLLALLVIGFRSELLEGLYGARYEAAASSLSGLAVGMVFYGGFMALANAAVGWGRPGMYTAGMVLAAVAQVAALAVFWNDEASTAAWCTGGAMALGFLLVLVLLLRRPLDVETPD